MFGLLYHSGLIIYTILLKIASFKNKKAYLWLEGRKNLFPEIANSFKGNKKPIAWFHCASLGEFEQARPLLEMFRNQFPHFKILLTFFSPSGYEIRKNYKHADYVFYLPLDTKNNVKKFLYLVHPTIVFFVKYEFWYNFLKEIHHQQINCILFSAIFRPNQLFFKSYGAFYKNLLHSFNRIFVQDNSSLSLLHHVGIVDVEVAGDTRFDRVKEIAQSKIDITLVALFCNHYKVVVIGSSWPQDIDVIFPPLENFPDLKIIIAPHEIKEENLTHIETRTSLSTIRFSKATSDNVSKYQVLIIDNIGLLSSLYQYGHIAYIGGGFGKGIHNVLEAVAFGLPVVFGPVYKKFKEARYLIEQGCGFSVSDSEEVSYIFNKLICNDLLIATLKHKIKNYLELNTGASKIIIEYCKKILVDERDNN